MFICGALVLDRNIGQYVTHGYYAFWTLGHWPSKPHGFGHHTPLGHDYPNFYVSCVHLNNSSEGATMSNRSKTKICFAYCSLLCNIGQLVASQILLRLPRRGLRPNSSFSENFVTPYLGPQAPIHEELEPAKLDLGVEDMSTFVLEGQGWACNGSLVIPFGIPKGGDIFVCFCMRVHCWCPCLAILQ